MKKIWIVLMALGLAVSFAFADEGKETGEKGKTLMITGILVDVNCYLKDGHKGDDHDAMKKCGRDCLKDGLPAGILVGKKLYMLVFPGPVFADYVGKTVEVTGEMYAENVMIPEKAWVLEEGSKKAIKLRGKVMM